MCKTQSMQSSPYTEKVIAVPYMKQLLDASHNLHSSETSDGLKPVKSKENRDQMQHGA
jgi:hypothetical protein